MSVDSKPDLPRGQTPGEFFERANSPTPPPRHKESAKSRPLGQKNRAKTPSLGQLSSKIQQKTQDRNYEKQYWNANMSRNIKTVKHIKAQSFLLDGFYRYSKYFKSISIHLQTNTRNSWRASTKILLKLMSHWTIFSDDLPRYDIATKIGVMWHVMVNNFLRILKRGNTLHVFDLSSKTCNTVAWTFSSWPVFEMACHTGTIFNAASLEIISLRIVRCDITFK